MYKFGTCQYRNLYGHIINELLSIGGSRFLRKRSACNGKTDPSRRLYTPVLPLQSYSECSIHIHARRKRGYAQFMGDGHGNSWCRWALLSLLLSVWRNWKGEVRRTSHSTGVRPRSCCTIICTYLSQPFRAIYCMWRMVMPYDAPE